MDSSPLPASESLTLATRHLLARFASSTEGKAFYLAGSAALALYLGHRPVRDADLMAGANRLNPADRRDLMATLHELDPELRVETARNGLLAVRAGSGVRLKLFYYPYPLLASHEHLEGCVVASRIDLALMKLAAIISRGSRRDFLDLYLLTRTLPLEEILIRAPEKFGHVDDFVLQALKGLGDLGDAIGEPMPRLTVDVAWPDVEAWIESEVHRLTLRHLGAHEGAGR